MSPFSPVANSDGFQAIVNLDTLKCVYHGACLALTAGLGYAVLECRNGDLYVDDRRVVDLREHAGFTPGVGGLKTVADVRRRIRRLGFTALPEAICVSLGEFAFQGLDIIPRRWRGSWLHFYGRVTGAELPETILCLHHDRADSYSLARRAVEAAWDDSSLALVLAPSASSGRA